MARKQQDEWLRQRIRAELRDEVRQQLTREFIQSGLVRITSEDHVNALIAGRNAWRGFQLLDELEQDFAAVGNTEAVNALRAFRRAANQANSRRRPADNRKPREPEDPRLLTLPSPAGTKLSP